MSANSSELMKLVLAQMAAESYLDGVTAAGVPVYEVEAARRERLKLGSNNYQTLNASQSGSTPSLPGYTRMTNAQVDEFNARYVVINHLPNTITGFSATLLRDNLDNRFVLSFRSTEYPNEDKGGDWRRDGLVGADGEIGNFGFAYAQIGDMEAYYQQIVKPLITDPNSGIVKNFAVTGYSLGGHLATVFAEAHQMDPGFLQAYTFNAPGHAAISGNMVSLANKAYQELSAPGVDALLRSGAGGESIYNADNFYTAANGIRATLQAFAGNPSGVNITAEGVAQNLAGGKIVQVFGQADTGDSTWAANSGVHSSNKVKLFIEDQPDVQGLGPITVLDGLTGVRSNFGTTHSITLIADTLAVMTMLQKLTPALTPEAMKTIFSTGSNERGIGLLLSNGLAEGGSLEQIVESLARLFSIDIAAVVEANNGDRKDGQLQRDDSGGGFGNWLNRNIFYAALNAISNAAGNAGNYQMEGLAAMSVADIIGAAGETSAKGIAYRYALKEGNSFAVIRDEALYATHNTGANAGALGLHSASNPAGALTTAWIQDRTDFLTRLNYYNNQNARYDLIKASENPSTNGDTTATQYDSEDIVWDDRTRNVLIRRGNETGVTAYRAFGSDATDSLNGGKNADHLYGSGGADQLIGKGDADYLEGGTGLDLYEYDSARKSGLFDLTTSADGNDTLLDIDGQGILRYQYADAQGNAQSTVLAGVAIKESEGKWKTLDGRFALEQTGANLKVTFGAAIDGSVTIRDFDFTKAAQDGYFGIRLSEARTAPQTVQPDILGDKKYADFTEARTQQKRPDGTPLGMTQIGSDFYETPAYGALPAMWLNVHLAPATGYALDHVVGAASYFVLPVNVTLLYNQADDFGNIRTIDALDPGHEDQLYDTAGNDNLIAGSGNDAIDASRGGADVISAGVGRDDVKAGAGNDLVEGGADGTVVLGLSGLVAGGDMIAGGVGDDELYSNVKIVLADAIKNSETDVAINAIGDFLSGEAGNDWIVGDKGNDALLGGDGDDTLVGGAGDDNLRGDDNRTAPDAAWSITRQIGGSASAGFSYQTVLTGVNTAANGAGGHDVLYGGAGVDWAFGGKGDDFIDGGSGADVLFGDEGSDVVIGGTENDVLVGDGANVAFEEQRADYLDGGVGNDTLQGDGGDDVLIGDVGEDILKGGDGNDTLIGGKGLDQLIGGSGKDTYVFNRGDGTEIIVDTADDAKSPEASVLVLGDGIFQSDIKFRKSSLWVDLGPSNADDPLAGNDQIHFTDFNGDFPELTAAIGELRFADGSSMDYADILAQGFDIDGTAFDDVASTALIGTSVTDRIRGFAGSDVLEGRDGDDALTGDGGADRLDGGNGNDVLDGGAGNDLLAGGMGSDDYRFVSDDGLDTLVEGSLFVRDLSDPDHVDRIVFGEGIARENVFLLRTGDGNLTVRYGIGDEILVEGQYSLSGSEIEEIAFFDGETISKVELDALEIGVVDGAAGNDEIYGSFGNDVLRGLGGDDYLDGGSTPERRVAGMPLVTGDDVLDGGTGADTYALHWEMGSDLIIDTNDGLSNTLKLLNGTTFNSVRTTRDGDDLLVNMRGVGGGSARVQNFFADGSAATWQIESEVDGSQSLFDLYNAQSAVANEFAADAMEDYKQRLLGEWRRQSQASLDLPTRVYVQSTWSQTTAQWTTLVPAFPESVPQVITIVSAPTTHTTVQRFGFQQGGHVIELPQFDGAVVQRIVDPYVEDIESNDSFISMQSSSGVTSDFFEYTFFAGGGGPFSNPRTYSYSNGFVTNTVTESSAEGWIPLTLREDGLGQFNLTIQQLTEVPVIEQITAGAGNNTIFGALENDDNHVALIDAGAGNDVVTAGQYDFIFGNDGSDRIRDGAYAYGGNGFDSLSDARFMAGGADDDFLSGGEGETTFYFRSDEAGWDQVRDQSGISLTEFTLRAGFANSLSNLIYGGKYRLGGESSLEFELVLRERFGGLDSDAYQSLFSTLTYAEIDLGDGEMRRYAVLPAVPNFPRGIPDSFFRGPYSGDGYDTWVYNSVEDMMRDFADLSLPFNPADASLIPDVPDLSDFTANNYRALKPFFESGILERDTVELADFQIGVDELLVGFGWVNETEGEHRVLRLVWGNDKAIDIELPTATDLIGHGIEEVQFGQGMSSYIGDLIEIAEEEGMLAAPSGSGLIGTAGDDRIRGLGGLDYIEGGAGNDVLSGGVGIDEFFFTADDGSDIILDPDAEDLILFDTSVMPNQIRLGLGSLLLGYGSAGDEIHFQGFNPDDVYGTTLFAALQFYNIEGPVDDEIWTLTDEVTFTDVLGQGFDIDGTAGDDMLRGTNIHDRFTGGAGNDFLAGGAGSDTYFFDAGARTDTVTDATEGDSINRIVLHDYLEADITGFRDGQYVVLQVNDTDDVVRILWDEATGAGIDLVEFADGATWDRAFLNQLDGVTNSPPVVATPIGAISVAEDAGLNFVISANTFQDPDAGDVLTYTATLTDGGALPSWLSFDAETRTFSGTPLEADVGTISVQVTVTDGSNASVADTFNLTVLNTNDAPVLVTALADQNAVEDQAFSFTMPADAFTDEDAGDQLTYVAALSNGAALPEWLAFDDATNTFSGVPANGDTGALNIRVTATDGDGVSMSDTFTVTVAGANDAPELSSPLLDQAITAGTIFNYVVPVETFIDMDAGDSVTLSAQLAGGAALPSWLAFDAATGTFSGTFSGIPSASNVGVLVVEVVAMDTSGASGSDQFVLTVNPATGLVLTGTAVADTLTGGFGNDVIDGLTGADQMSGGDGDDRYIVDNINDAVLENPEQGHDAVLSSVTYTLAAEVEDLMLTGTVNRNGTGNDLANTITGNTGANRLDGGMGADTLIGGLGNDTYVIDDVLDTVFEAPSAGTDTVQSSVSTMLSANVENLTLTGEATIDGTGNELANTITGNNAANTLIGGMGNDKLIGSAGVDTLLGGIGNDTYIIDLINEFMVELADEGTDTVQSPFDFTLADHFENLTLTGDALSGTGNAAANRLTGNALANVLTGLEGNDILDGKGGADTLIGGIGNDTYVVDNSADITVELAGEGTDTVQATVSYAIGAEIERLTLTGSAETSGTGNALDNRLTGNAAVNTLSGLEGNDILDGKAGADTLIGGAGSDAYIVDSSGDAIVELASEGVDAVTSSVTYTLAANVENLTLSGTAVLDGMGNDLGNRLTGNIAANVLTGLNGNDILDGKAGADTLVGGAGDDIYIIDNADDTTGEASDEGTDTVQTTLAWILGDNVENLTLTGTAAVSGMGNSLDNVLTGNNAANVLTGFAGNDTLDGKAGADTLIGGSGDDTYVVDNVNDGITELVGEGTDTVRSSTTRTLGAELEHLTLIGAGNISGTGNALNNVITGNTGNNVLDGGLGADVMAGGLGNDTYIVDDPGDAVVEAAGGGVDIVKTGMAYTLTANVESLTLTGTAAVMATGNELANILIGNIAANMLAGLDGNDVLDGKAGADIMTGGAGDDVYTIDNAGDTVTELAGEGVDTVRSSLTYLLGDNIENLALTGGASRNGTGNVLNNILTGNNGANILNGLAGDDALAGGLGSDTYRFDLNFGNDVIVEDDATAGNLDRIVFGAGIASTDIKLGRLNDDLVAHTADQQHSIQVLNWFTADANKVERIEFANGVTWDLAAINATAMQTVDMPGLLRGSDQISVLLGQIGNTVLEGADGDDTLVDIDGNNIFVGGAGDDAATSGAGNDLFIGGAGNDTLTTGAGNNVIAYNAGGGVDTVYSDAGAGNTLSLGGGLGYSDLSLSRDNNDLVLNTGADDKIIFKDWYAGQDTLLNLQLILDATDEFDANSTDSLYNRRVQNFNFLGLVSTFDAAQTANPGLTSWALSDALMQYHLSGADDAALGGDLAYWYARNDGLTGISLSAAQGVIGASGFGSDAQSLRPFSGLQEGLVHLS